MPAPRHFVIIGNPEHKRVANFQQALQDSGWPSATVIPYLELLKSTNSLEAHLQPGACVRIESPGQNAEVERELLALGADCWDRASPATFTRSAALQLPAERGRILAPRQWYRGYAHLLNKIDSILEAFPAIRVLSDPAEITTMFDKPASHARFTAAGIPVPRSLGIIRSYEELLETMRTERQPRVFVKLAYGSSASGVVAFATNWKQQKATTTVEVIRTAGETQFYNSRKIRCYQRPEEIATIIDAICQEDAQVETWLPKAALDRTPFDLRVLVIAGEPQHIVIRQSRSPLTNLHLLNQRGHLSHLLGRISPKAWQRALQSCRAAAACFPGTMCVGIDLLITPDFRRHAILEVNAFGDLLPGITCGLRNSYNAQIAAIPAEEFHPRC